MKFFLLLLALGALLVLAAVLVALAKHLAKNPASEPEAGKASALVAVGESRLFVEVADTPAKRGRGLSGRLALAEDQGLFFVFDEPGVYPFWMREMQFPIDILWIDADRRVAGITANVSPATYPERFYPPVPVQYVLEVNAGWAEKNHIVSGAATSYAH